MLDIRRTLALLILGTLSTYFHAQEYDHDRYAPDRADIRRDFEAFVLSFDSKDDDDGDMRPDVLRVPEWVAQEIKRFDGECIQTEERQPWVTDRALYSSGVAPNSLSYEGSGYDRGHMAAKFLAARISIDADEETHTLLNSVPQLPRFNSFIWQDLEELTGAWAQEYERIWIIQGPVFDTKRQNRPHWTRYLNWIGESEHGERTVAVPDALFKIVVREVPLNYDTLPAIDALAFIFPQVGPWYHKEKSELREQHFGLERFITTIGEIEELSGLSFLKLSSLKDLLPTTLWTVADDQFVPSCERE